MINANEYRQDAHGNLVALSNIKEEDLLRDETVKTLLSRATSLREKMIAEKDQIFSDFNAYVDLVAEQYGVKLGGKKGNTTIQSFDGKYRVEFAINERIQLDEKINAAKALIDECIKDWSTGSNNNVVTLINQAFRVDKLGNLNHRRILELRNVKIDDPRWNRAMDAISDSIKVIDSKEYIRFYERQENGGYRQISLDFSAI